jgi:hypothetical protein
MMKAVSRILVFAGLVCILAGCGGGTAPATAPSDQLGSAADVQYRAHSCMGLCSGNRHVDPNGDPVVVTTRFGQLVEVSNP